jgi:hypothetical protein
VVKGTWQLGPQQVEEVVKLIIPHAAWEIILLPELQAVVLTQPLPVHNIGALLFLSGRASDPVDKSYINRLILP